jgi:hypothetical protein
VSASQNLKKSLLQLDLNFEFLIFKFIELNTQVNKKQRCEQATPHLYPPCECAGTIGGEPASSMTSLTCPHKMMLTRPLPDFCWSSGKALIPCFQIMLAETIFEIISTAAGVQGI